MADFIRQYWYYFAAGAGTLLALILSLCVVNRFEVRSINKMQKKAAMQRVCTHFKCLHACICCGVYLSL